MKLLKYVLLLLGISISFTAAQGDNIISSDDSTKAYEVDEMIITGTRTLKKIIDIPYSVQRINNYEYRYERKNSASDVLSGIPGLFFQNRYGNHDVRISIRGFGSRSNSGIRGVRILLDDIPESEPDGQTRIEAIDFQSIGRIEIVKGNASSLYTNAPGGVINFINDIDFNESHIVQFNEAASFGSRNNGFKLALKGDGYKFLTTYSYHTAEGYRKHSNDYWNIVNSVYETAPNDESKMTMLLYYVDGLIKLPGSLTQAQYEKDPFMSNPRDVGRDAKRVSKKGRIGIRYNTLFGGNKNNELEITGYGTTKYFERTAATYRFFNRNGFGGTGRWVHKTSLFDFPVEVSLGMDLFHQYGPIEEYPNIGGKKGEPVDNLTDEIIDNVGAYFLTTISLLPDKLDLLITGRQDKVLFDQSDRNLEVRNAKRVFEKFTPKVSANYKITPVIGIFSSFGYSFDSPAGNEMENYPLSTNFPRLINPDLQPQYSQNVEIGMKGMIMNDGYFSQTRFELVLFNSIIQDEIVPFSIGSDVFYRNAAETKRTGIEFGIATDIISGLQFKLAYTFSDFLYNRYVARTYNASGDTITDKIFSGKIVPSVPEHNFSSSLSYQQQIIEKMTGFVKTNFNFVSGMYVNDENSSRSGDYQIVNATVGTDIVSGNVNFLVSCGINNIFNKTHIAFININSDRKEFFESGEPRNYYASFNIGYTL
ncbi:MAG: TonB-dependent receptor [Bacteroidota bacterium]